MGEARRSWDRQYLGRRRLWRGEATLPFHIPEGETVLELGCGNGKTMASLYGSHSVIGLDHSREGLRACLTGLRGARVIQADAGMLPFRDGSFDAVLMFHLLGHLPSGGRRVVVTETSRVLRPGGVVYVCEFSADDMRYGRGEEVEPGSFRRATGIVTHYFTMEELISLFRGYEPLETSNETREVRYGGERLRRDRLVCSFRAMARP